MAVVRRRSFCNAFSLFDVTLGVSFIKECFCLKTKGKFYIISKFLCSFFVIQMEIIEIRFRVDIACWKGYYVCVV